MQDEAAEKYFDKVKNMRAGWGPGEWDNEPDYLNFKHAGLPCILRRGPVGAWCGYAGVPPGHPAHGKDYSDIDVDVHGGLTYSNECQGSVCHKAEPGEPEDIWWFGFDCAHAYDLSPGLSGFSLSGRGGRVMPEDVYRTIGYVKTETMGLAEQLAAMK